MFYLITPKTLMIRFFLILFAFFQLVFGESPVGTYRIWTSGDGREIEAAYYGSRGETAELQIKGKATTSQVPASRFSENDQEYLRAESWQLGSKHWSGWRNNIIISKFQVDFTSVNEGEYYESDHFRIRSNGKLVPDTWRSIFRQLESFYLLMKSSPWGIESTPKSGKFDIVIAENEYGYRREGGPEGSAGVFMIKEQLVLTFPEAMGIRNGELPKYFSLQVLSHELVHLLMDNFIRVCPAWMIEGMAEYVELFSITSGKISTNSHHKNSTTYAQRNGFSSLGLPDLVRMPLREWHADPGGVRMKYFQGFLICYYLLESDKRENIPRLMRYLDAKKASAEAVNEAFNSSGVAIASYKEEYEVYKKAMKEFFDRPDVHVTEDVETGNRSFTAPEGVKPPTPPADPDVLSHEDYDAEVFKYLELLYPPDITEAQFIENVIEFSKERGLVE